MPINIDQIAFKLFTSSLLFSFSCFQQPKLKKYMKMDNVDGQMFESDAFVTVAVT